MIDSVPECLKSETMDREAYLPKEMDQFIRSTTIKFLVHNLI